MPTISPTSSSNGHRPPGETSEARIAKALAHPLRARILQRLGERVASPGDLAVELGAPLGVVSYHVRMLRDYDCVELVRTEPRRGALQHFYKATARPNLDEGQWRTLPSGLRRELAGETIAELVSDLGAAADAGKLEDPEVVVTRTPLELDEKGFKKLNKLILSSNTWRMCKRAIPEYLAADPEDRLLWRVPYKRLEAEAIRDSILAVSGRLNPRMYGPSVFPAAQPQALEGSSDPDKIWKASAEEDASRRSCGSRS